MYKFPNFPVTKESLILLVIILSLNWLMDYNHLRFGTKVASEAQLKYGSVITSEEKTGPDENYSMEAEDLIKEQVIRRDPRVKNTSEVQIDRMPERMPTYYGNVDRRRGYIGNGYFRTFFWYIVREQGKAKMTYGYGVTKLSQSVLGFGFVKQVMTIEDLKITRSE